MGQAGTYIEREQKRVEITGHLQQNFTSMKKEKETWCSSVKEPVNDV
jgi:hypothetical protein